MKTPDGKCIEYATDIKSIEFMDFVVDRLSLRSTSSEQFFCRTFLGGISFSKPKRFCEFSSQLDDVWSLRSRRPFAGPAKVADTLIASPALALQ